MIRVRPALPRWKSSCTTGLLFLAVSCSFPRAVAPGSTWPDPTTKEDWTALLAREKSRNPAVEMRIVSIPAGPGPDLISFVRHEMGFPYGGAGLVGLTEEGLVILGTPEELDRAQAYLETVSKKGGDSVEIRFRAWELKDRESRTRIQAVETGQKQTQRIDEAALESLVGGTSPLHDSMRTCPVGRWTRVWLRYSPEIETFLLRSMQGTPLGSDGICFDLRPDPSPAPGHTRLHYFIAAGHSSPLSDTFFWDLRSFDFREPGVYLLSASTTFSQTILVAVTLVPVIVSSDPPR